MDRRADGFTLLEILIVIAVTSILLTTAFQAYLGIMDAQQRALADNRRDGVTALVLDRLESELVGTLLVKNGAAVANGSGNSERAGSNDEERAGKGDRPSAADNGGERAGNDGAASGDDDRDEDDDRQSRDGGSDDPDDEQAKANPWIFVGADGGPGERASDSIRFVTQTPARGVSGPASAGLRVVSYEVRATEGDRAALFRAEDLLSAGAPEPPNFNETPAVDDVYQLRIRYQGEDATWVDNWNSQADENKDDLPLAVELTLQLEERDAEGTFKTGRELTRVVALPLRPIGDAEDDEEGGADCPDGGKTVEQCLMDNEQALSALNASPESKSLLDTLRGESGSVCVNDRKATAKLAPLNDLLREAGAPNLKTLCGRK